MTVSATKPALTLLLTFPRGFCAGVVRAIDIVETALRKFGPPIYVRHEIVHNSFVVRSLAEKGAIFVDDLDEVPAGARVVFSAHGVPNSVPAAAADRDLLALDATCPLVSKVHREVVRSHENGFHVVLIGHAGHPEVAGTTGQLPPGTVLLVENAADVAALAVANPAKLAYVTQTTLAADDTAEIVAALKARFPAIRDPQKNDICYATTNRQEAVKAVASRADVIMVVGSANSSNSLRLVEVAKKAGCARAFLVPSAKGIDWRWLDGAKAVGISAGASAPEALVQEIIAAFHARFRLVIEDVVSTIEDVRFNLPQILRT